MVASSPNPYESPSQLPDSAPAKPAVDLLRGLIAAVIGAAVGFAIPAIYMCIEFRVQSLDHLAQVLHRAAEMCAVCTAMCCLAAFLSFTPSRRMSFMGAFLCVSGLAFLGLVVMVIATITFNLGAESKTSDPWLWLRIFVILVVMIAGTIFLTWRQVCKTQHRAR